MRYMIALCEAARDPDKVRLGPSPRALLALMRCAQAFAAIRGRDYVIPEDIKTIWIPVMAHRLVLTSEARFQKKTAELVLEEIMHNTAVPPYRKELFHERKSK